MSHAKTARALALATVAAAVAASLASAASGSRAAFIGVRADDVLDVVGTKVACALQKDGVLCFHTRDGKFIPRTFGAALNIDRRAVIFRVNPSGEPKVVARRPQAAGGAAGRVVKLRAGQVARLKGTRLDCAVVRSEGKPTIYCSNDDAVGPIPGTHAILLNDEVATIGRVEKTRRTTIVVLRRQP